VDLMDHVQKLVNILEERMNYTQMLMDHEYIEVKLNTNSSHQLFISASQFYRYEHKNFPLVLQ
jgi:hypothetical protein